MAIPAIAAFAGRVAAWTGLSAGFSKIAPKIIPKAKSALNAVKSRFGIGAAAGGAAGFSLASVRNWMEQNLGIGGTASNAVIGFGLLIAVLALGQLFDFNVDL